MQHLAIIMDGNRRWAKKNNLAPFLGHEKGKDTTKIAIDFCIKNSIKYLSLYTFSLENFNRSEKEKEHIFNLLSKTIENQLNEFIDNEIKINFIGNRDSFPKNLLQKIESCEEKTKNFDKLHLNILFCYGGRQELIDCVKKISLLIKNEILSVDEIDTKIIQDFLWTKGIPDPDLIIRTGGVMRISNFLLYQSAYSEFAFLDCYWPEITEEHLVNCLNKFYNTQRNFGK